MNRDRIAQMMMAQQRMRDIELYNQIVNPPPMPRSRPPEADMMTPDIPPQPPTTPEERMQEIETYKRIMRGEQ